MEEQRYDSSKATRIHKDNIFNVITLLLIPEMYTRAEDHDNSKLEKPEKQIYDEFIPKLKTAKYGTPEYEKIKADMRAAGGDHHNHVNRHHPEFFDNGIHGMTLHDLNEMICDWFAASLVSDTDFIEGLKSNIDKYGIPPMLESIIVNTYFECFKKFEVMMKTKDQYLEGELLKDYKLIAYESNKKGLYSDDTRDWLLNQLWDIIYKKHHPDEKV